MMGRDPPPELEGDKRRERPVTEHSPGVSAVLATSPFFFNWAFPLVLNIPFEYS